ncbi:hypothetical protein ACRPFF_04475 [Neisseria sp. SLRRB23]|uniref:hypothetical protein n=2 Tax=Neisseria TaxID=482 RepID=UPI00265C045F
MKKIMMLCAVALSVSACVSTELSSANKPYNPSSDARIRLYGQNGRPTVLTIDPKGKAEKVVVGGGMGQSMASLFHLKGNESIGMPESEFSKNPSQFNNIGSNAFFKEFIVPANVEIALKNTINAPAHVMKNAQGNTVYKRYLSCDAGTLTFKPEAGKDYEAVPAPSTHQCGIQLIELQK